jgi:hypothetical protein
MNNDPKPGRQARGRDTLRDFVRVADARDARPASKSEPRRPLALPSLVQLAFSDPLPSDYYLG